MSSKKEVPVLRSNAYFIRVTRLNEDAIDAAKRKFTLRFYHERACEKCEYLEDRHGDTCEECSAYKGAVQLSSVTPNGKYLKLPMGDRKGVISWFKAHDLKPKVIDGFAPEAKVKPFRFIRKPYDYQITAADALIEAERGVLSSPPRSGKTVIGALIAQKLQVKTIVLAHQREWLENFHETFVGSDTEEAFTDIRKKRVGFCKTLEDFESKDVAFATFQQFFNERGRKVLARIANLFNLVIVDEVHQSPAKESSKVLAAFKGRYRIGLSGSPDRKDCLAPGTPIALADGSSKPVEQLKAGNLVLSFNHESRQVEKKRVTETWSVRKPRKMKITLASGRVIVCSECERFAVGNQYVEARALAVGSELWLLRRTE